MTSATERIRAMLDERGVEYTVVHGYHEYIWEFGESGIARASRIGTKGLIQMIVTGITPEQAIAATLGSCNCSDNCTNGERTETCRADETDTWECVRDDLGGYGKTMTVHVMECTECGHVYEHVNGDYEYCPRCGRKRRDVEQ